MLDKFPTLKQLIFINVIYKRSILEDKTFFVFKAFSPLSICAPKKLSKRIKAVYIITGSDENAYFTED